MWKEKSGLVAENRKVRFSFPYFEKPPCRPCVCLPAAVVCPELIWASGLRLVMEWLLADKKIHIQRACVSLGIALSSLFKIELKCLSVFSCIFLGKARGQCTV